MDWLSSIIYLLKIVDISRIDLYLYTQDLYPLS